jgi:hypothetical protein
MFRIGTLGLASLLTMSAMSFAQTPVEHGRYLVEGVLTCGNCHSPRGPGGVIDTTRLYSGGPQTWDEPTFKVKGANITPDHETGIGAWSEGDIKKAVTEGIRPTGVQLASIMPYGFYKVFTPAISTRWSLICVRHAPWAIKSSRQFIRPPYTSIFRPVPKSQ